MKTNEKPFVAAYNVIKILNEQGLTQPSIMLFEDGTGYLSLAQIDYNKFKSLAESLVLSTKWFRDLYGNYCLSISDGLQREDK